MTESSEHPQTPRRSWLKRALGLLFISVLLAGAGTAGGVFWLRSAEGELWVRETLTTTLQKTGITAEIGQLSGPLPEALRLQDIQLRDEKGLWFSASEALIRLELWEILTGTLRIETISLRDGRLIRAPILPPAEAPETSALAGLNPRQIQANTRILETAAAHIVCDRFLLEDFSVGTEGTAESARINASGAGPLTDFRLYWEVSSPLLTLAPPNPEQQIRLKGTILVGTKGEWRTSESLPLPAGPALKLQTNLAPIFFPEEPMREAPLSALLSMGEGSLAINSLEASLPGGSLSLKKIHANTEELKGRLLLTLTDPAELADALLEKTSEYKETAKSPQPLPQTIELQAGFSGTLENPHCELNIKALHMPSGDRTSNAALALQVALNGLFTVPDLSARGTLDVTSLFKESSAQKPQSAPEMPIAGTERSTTEEEIKSQVPAQTDLHIELTAHANTETASLELSDPKANLLLSAKGNIPDQRAELRLELGAIEQTIHEITAWIPALAATQIQNMAGRAALNASFQQVLTQEKNVLAPTSPEKKQAQEPTREKEGIKTVNAQLSLDLTQMVWALPQAQGLLGSNATLNISGSVQPATGNLRVDELRLAAEQLQITGHGTLQNLTTLNSQIEFHFSDLSALEPNLSGDLRLDLQAHGPIIHPSITLNLRSPRLAYTGVTLQNLHMGISSPRLDPSGNTGTIDLTGAIQHAARPEHHSVPLRFQAAWDAAPEKIQVKDAALNAEGLSLTGDLLVRNGTHFSGGCSLAITDWTFLSLLTGVALQGQPAQANFRLAPDQSLEANWQLGTLRASGFRLRGLTGSARLAPRQKQPHLRLETTLDAGQSGELAWRKGSLAINGPLSDLAFDAALNGRTNFNCAGQLNLEAQQILLSRLNLTQRRQAYTSGLKLTAPTTIRFRNGVSIEALHLALAPSGTIDLSGQFTPQKTDFTVRLRELSLAFAQAFSASLLPEGLLNGEMQVNGSGRTPQGTLRLDIEKLGYRDSEIPPAAIHLTGTLSARALRLNASMDGFGPQPALASVSLPLHSASGFPELDLHAPLSGQASWEGALPALWRFVPLANTALAGHGLFNATVSGTLSSPRSQASFVIQNADFEDVLAGLQLTGIDADVQFDSNEISTLTASAGDGQGGSVRIQGTLGTLAAGFPLALTGTVKNLAPLHRSDLALTLSGNVSLSGPLTAPEIGGALTVDKGQYTILASFGTSIPTLDVVEAGQVSAAPSGSQAQSSLNIQLAIPRQFFVRGAGLDSEWKGALTITGPVSNPVVLGSIASVRGNLSLLGKDFVLTKSRVSFTGATPPNPMLDIDVTCQAETITAEATISGSASSPSLTLSSHPPLPTDEIVAQILFGQGAASLGRMEALQLAAELASLAGFGTGGSGLLGGIRDSLGVDVLRFGSIKGPSRQSSRMGLLQPDTQANAESESIPALEVGKYITDGVYVGVEQGISDESTGIRVEIELTPNLNMEASTTPKQSEIGVTWKKDYK